MSPDFLQRAPTPSALPPSARERERERMAVVKEKKAGGQTKEDIHEASKIMATIVKAKDFGRIEQSKCRYSHEEKKEKRTVALKGKTKMNSNVPR